jgi:hypothetical protein
MMLKMLSVSALAAGLVAPGSIGAFAQDPASDAKYCAALIGTYEKYLVETRDPDTKGPLRADLDTAVAKCRAGDTAAGIPPLEKALHDAKFNLPPRV